MKKRQNLQAPANNRARLIRILRDPLLDEFLVGKSDTRPTVVYEVGRPDYHLRKTQYKHRIDGLAELRSKQTKLKQAGRMDLALKCVTAPVQLEWVAKVLWSTRRTGPSPVSEFETQIVFSPGYNFPKRFDLERSEGHGEERRVPHIADLNTDNILTLIKVARQKFLFMADREFLSCVAQPANEKSRKAAVKVAIRKWAIKNATLWSLEEWACIFRDAALAGDVEFIKKIIAAHEAQRSPLDDLTDREMFLALSWERLIQRSSSGDMVPPTKYWSDMAARELVRWRFGLPEAWSLGAYQQLKRRLGLHKEKATFVASANYLREGNTHRLSCLTFSR